MISNIQSLLKPGTGMPQDALAHKQTPGNKKSDGLGFADLLDIVNPLQHLPVVGHIYREITHDTIHPLMKLAGGALFGGPIGFLVSAVSTALSGNGEKQPEINPAGIDPATVAGTYPFAKPANMETSIANLDQAVASRHVYADGIPNPATQTRAVYTANKKSPWTQQLSQVVYSDGIPNPARQIPAISVTDMIAMRYSKKEAPPVQDADLKKVYSENDIQQKQPITNQTSTPLVNIAG